MERERCTERELRIVKNRAHNDYGKQVFLSIIF